MLVVPWSVTTSCRTISPLGGVLVAWWGKGFQPANGRPSWLGLALSGDLASEVPWLPTLKSTRAVAENTPGINFALAPAISTRNKGVALRCHSHGEVLRCVQLVQRWGCSKGRGCSM